MLVACASENNQAQPPHASTWKQAQSTSQAEIVIKLCHRMSESDLLTIMKAYALEIKQKVSPTVIVVSWHDNHTRQSILDKLQKSEKFCGVQENLQVQMMGK